MQKEKVGERERERGGGGGGGGGRGREREDTRKDSMSKDIKNAHK